jgi:hypothetical protein
VLGLRALRPQAVAEPNPRLNVARSRQPDADAVVYSRQGRRWAGEALKSTTSCPLHPAIFDSATSSVHSAPGFQEVSARVNHPNHGDLVRTHLVDETIPPKE